MKNYFYVDTDQKLKEIFHDYCNLSPEQYEELRAEMIYLVSDYQEGEPQAEIEKRIAYLKSAFEFLYNTKELSVKQHYELGELIEKIRTEAERGAIRAAMEKGTVL